MRYLNKISTHFLLILITTILHADMQIFFSIFFRNVCIFGNNLHRLRNYFKKTFYNFNASLQALFTIHLFTESLVDTKSTKHLATEAFSALQTVQQPKKRCTGYPRIWMYQSTLDYSFQDAGCNAFLIKLFSHQATKFTS